MINAERMLKLLQDAKVRSEKAAGFDGAAEAFFPSLMKAIKMCENDILESAIKAKPGGASIASRRKAAMKFIDGIPDYRSEMRGAWMVDGKQCLCDGFIAVLLDEPLPELPEVGGIDAKGIIKSAEGSAESGGIPLPSIKEHKAKIKMFKADPANKDKRPLEMFRGAGFDWHYDPKLMVQLMEILGGEDFKIYLPKRQYGLGVVKSSNGMGIICPVRA